MSKGTEDNISISAWDSPEALKPLGKELKRKEKSDLNVIAENELDSSILFVPERPKPSVASNRS